MAFPVIGAAVRELRAQNGWNLREFAAEVDISPGYLSKIERGGERGHTQPNVSPSVAGRIALALDVPIEALTNRAVFNREIEKARLRPPFRGSRDRADAVAVA